MSRFEAQQMKQVNKELMCAVEESRILGHPAVRTKCISCSLGDAAEIQFLLYFSAKQKMA